jgi:hypothetical protein
MKMGLGLGARGLGQKQRRTKRVGICELAREIFLARAPSPEPVAARAQP